MPVKLPLKIALLWISASVILISGSFALALYFYQMQKRDRLMSPEFTIKRIVQTSGSKESLKSTLLEELLDLSKDVPQNLYQYSLEEGEKRLLAHPLIKEAKLAKIYPNSLYVDYTLKEPIAIDIDWENSAIDKEGMRFPLRPFLTPKSLPRVYFGGHEGLMPLFKELIFALSNIKGARIELLDLSRITDASWGRREIDIEITQSYQQKRFRCFLRLPVKNWTEAISDYETLLSKGLITGQNGDIIVDLRLAGLALLKGNHD